MIENDERIELHLYGLGKEFRIYKIFNTVTRKLDKTQNKKETINCVS